MIPHIITIKNFLSYGAQSQTIHFDPYHLIALSGKNGHGKSALLDAMTWAVWGIARKTLQSVKPDQGLLRLGQNEMMVTFEFSCNGTRYKIRREFINHHNKPYAQLEFGVINESTGTYTPLTDKTIKNTQAVIESTLRLSYETFVNSVFLKQGSSNEFSKKSAKERKEILSAILDLNQYETIKRRALQKIKMKQLEQSTKNSFAQKLLLDIAPYDEIVTTIHAKSAELEHLQKDIRKAEALRNSTLNQEKQLLVQQQQRVSTSAEITELQQKQTVLNQGITQDRTALHELSLLLRDLAHVTLLHQQKEALVKNIDHHQKLFQEHLECKQALLNLSGQLQRKESEREHKKRDAQQTLQLQIHTIASELQALQRTHNQHEQEINENKKNVHEKNRLIISLHEQQEAHAAIAQAYEAQKRQFEKRKNCYQQWVAQGNMLKQQLQDIHQKQLLTQSTSAPSCPLCQQNLSAARKKFLHQTLQTHVKKIHHTLARLTKMMPTLKNILVTHHETIERMQKEQETFIINHERLTVLQKELILLQTEQQMLIDQQTECAKKITDVENAHKLLIQKEQDLLNNHEPDLEQITMYQTIAQKEKMLTELGYNPQKHAADIEQLARVQALIAKAHSQEHLFEEQKKIRAKLIQTIASARTIKNEIRQKQHAMAPLNTIEQQMNNVQNMLKTIEQELQQYMTQKEHLLTTIAEKKQEEKRILERKHDITQIQKELLEIIQDIQDYTLIAQATGKDGVPALLIEDIIPEIEQEANLLLSKLTNNSAHIFIESLKDLKSGGTKETLDIKIADAAGIRHYEMFSGGEAFRIDFSLRIAISKLLARRAGTSLQTLIIDEGFGSQDEEGLGHIMDALYKVQDDFAKIIIVSHLSEMKHQFPVHFVVHKGVQGSQITVLEQD